MAIADEIPHSMTLTALVTVDVQVDFLDPAASPLAGEGHKAFCVPGIRKLLDFAEASEWQVVHVRTVHDSRDTLPNHLRRSHTSVFCLNGRAGTELVIPPRPRDQIVSKRLYSAFRGTDLEDRLREAGATQVIFCGVATDCCILQSTFEADDLGFYSFVPLQAVSASTIHGFSGGLASIAKSAAGVVDLDAVLAGSECSAAVIPVKGVGDVATKWFGERDVRIRGLQGQRTLDLVLRALDE